MVIKKFLAAAALITSTFFVSGQSLGTYETSAIREFLEDGYYIEYRNSSGQYVIKSQDKIVGIRESKDKKNTIEIIDVNGDVDSVSWSEISIDLNSNLTIIPKIKSDKQIISNLQNNQHAPDEKKLTIYSWNEEFLDLIKNYYPDYNAATNKIGNVKLEYVITPSYDYYNYYRENLFNVLEDQNSEGGKNQVDIIILEPDYIKQFAGSSYFLDMKEDLGFTDEDLSKQFKYIKDTATVNGKLKGLAWQCNPSGVIYRRSIAKSIFGTDDPDKIQEILSDWDKFNDAAKKLKENGYYIVSGYDDTYKAFAARAKTPWIIDGTLNIDNSILDWISQQNEFAENDFTPGYEMWAEEFFSQMTDTGKTFCYLGSNWFIDYVITSYAKSDYYDYTTYGDWGFCKGPQGFDWGGSLLCVAKGTDNLPLVKDILEKLTMDDSIMREIAANENQFVNNEKVMRNIASGRNGKGVLGGQNISGILIDCAKSIDSRATGPYDYKLSEMLKNAMHLYFKGSVPLNTAWSIFFSAVREQFPDLEIPEQRYY